MTTTHPYTAYLKFLRQMKYGLSNEQMKAEEELDKVAAYYTEGLAEHTFAQKQAEAEAKAKAAEDNDREPPAKSRFELN